MCAWLPAWELLGVTLQAARVRRQVAAGRQVVTLDMRNHGHSPHSDDMSWTAMAECVAQACHVRWLAARGWY